jgi:hypothetical protein
VAGVPVAVNQTHVRYWSAPRHPPVTVCTDWRWCLGARLFDGLLCSCGLSSNPSPLPCSTVDANDVSVTVAPLTADRTMTLEDLTGTLTLSDGAWMVLCDASGTGYFLSGSLVTPLTPLLRGYSACLPVARRPTHPVSLQSLVVSLDPPPTPPPRRLMYAFYHTCPLPVWQLC